MQPLYPEPPAGAPADPGPRSHPSQGSIDGSVASAGSMGPRPASAPRPPPPRAADHSRPRSAGGTGRQKHYIEQHDLHRVLGAIVDDVLRDEPDDPQTYIAARLAGVDGADQRRRIAALGDQLSSLRTRADGAPRSAASVQRQMLAAQAADAMVGEISSSVDGSAPVPRPPSLGSSAGRPGSASRSSAYGAGPARGQAWEGPVRPYAPPPGASAPSTGTVTPDTIDAFRHDVARKMQHVVRAPHTAADPTPPPEALMRPASPVAIFDGHGSPGPQMGRPLPDSVLRFLGDLEAYEDSGRGNMLAVEAAQRSALTSLAARARKDAIAAHYRRRPRQDLLQDLVAQRQRGLALQHLLADARSRLGSAEADAVPRPPGQPPVAPPRPPTGGTPRPPSALTAAVVEQWLSWEAHARAQISQLETAQRDALEQREMRMMDEHLERALARVEQQSSGVDLTGAFAAEARSPTSARAGMDGMGAVSSMEAVATGPVTFVLDGPLASFDLPTFVSCVAADARVAPGLVDVGSLRAGSVIVELSLRGPEPTAALSRLLAALKDPTSATRASFPNLRSWQAGSGSRNVPAAALTGQAAVLASLVCEMEATAREAISVREEERRARLDEQELRALAGRSEQRDAVADAALLAEVDARLDVAGASAEVPPPVVTTAEPAKAGIDPTLLTTQGSTKSSTDPQRLGHRGSMDLISARADSNLQAVSGASGDLSPTSARQSPAHLQHFGQIVRTDSAVAAKAMPPLTDPAAAAEPAEKKDEPAVSQLSLPGGASTATPLERRESTASEAPQLAQFPGSKGGTSESTVSRPREGTADSGAPGDSGAQGGSGMFRSSIDLVQHSWREVLDDPNSDATDSFYDRLFVRNAQLRELFGAVDLPAQAKKLMGMVSLAVDRLNRPEQLVPQLVELGTRHAGYGVLDTHYPLVEAALLDTLRDSLKGRYTPELEVAWQSCFQIIVTSMKRGAASERGQRLASEYCDVRQRGQTAADIEVKSDAELVRDSWQLLLSVRGYDGTGQQLYRTLFELDPTLPRTLFRSVDIEAQATRLISMLDLAVSMLEQPGELIPQLVERGVRHAGYGVEANHYNLIGEALFSLLSSTLGTALTPDARKAWERTFAVVSGAMVHGCDSGRGKENRTRYVGRQKALAQSTDTVSSTSRSRLDSTSGVASVRLDVAAEAFDKARFTAAVATAAGVSEASVHVVDVRPGPTTVEFLLRDCDDPDAALRRVIAAMRNPQSDLARGLPTVMAIQELSSAAATEQTLLTTPLTDATHAPPRTSSEAVTDSLANATDANTTDAHATDDGPSDVELVQQTWRALCEAQGNTGEVLYDALFRMMPSLQHTLFRSSDLAEQASKLTAMIDMAIGMLDDSQNLIGRLMELGERHAGYGVADEHYPVLGRVLLETLRNTVGLQFTAQAEAAWERTFGIIEHSMRRGASTEKALRLAANYFASQNNDDTSVAEAAAPAQAQWRLWVAERGYSGVAEDLHDVLYDADPSRPAAVFGCDPNAAPSTALSFVHVLDAAVWALAAPGALPEVLRRMLGAVPSPPALTVALLPSLRRGLVDALAFGLRDRADVSHWMDGYAAIHDALVLHVQGPTAPMAVSAKAPETATLTAALAAAGLAVADEEAALRTAAGVPAGVDDAVVTLLAAVLPEAAAARDDPAALAAIAGPVGDACAARGAEPEHFVPLLQAIGARLRATPAWSTTADAEWAVLAPALVVGLQEGALRGEGAAKRRRQLRAPGDWLRDSIQRLRGADASPGTLFYKALVARDPALQERVFGRIDMRCLAREFDATLDLGVHEPAHLAVTFRAAGVAHAGYCFTPADMAGGETLLSDAVMVALGPDTDACEDVRAAWVVHASAVVAALVEGLQSPEGRARAAECQLQRMGDAELVADLWAMLGEAEGGHDGFGFTVFEKYFGRHPAAALMFEGADLTRQSALLASGLGRIVAAVAESCDAATQAGIDLGVVHMRLAPMDPDRDLLPLRDALVSAAQVALGARCTPRHRGAWTAAMDGLVEHMRIGAVSAQGRTNAAELRHRGMLPAEVAAELWRDAEGNAGSLDALGAAVAAAVPIAGAAAALTVQGPSFGVRLDRAMGSHDVAGLVELAAAGLGLTPEMVAALPDAAVAAVTTQLTVPPSEASKAHLRAAVAEATATMDAAVPTALETRSDAELVTQTWAVAAEGGLQALGERFYQTLFELGPDLQRRLFHNVDLHSQSLRLTQMVDAAVKLLGDPDTLVEQLHVLGARHARYGVTEQHYPVVGHALLLTLQHLLGPRMTPDAFEAWRRTYGTIEAAMMEGGASPDAATSRMLARASAMWRRAREAVEDTPLGTRVFEELLRLDPALGRTVFAAADMEPLRAALPGKLGDILGTREEGAFSDAARALGTQHAGYGIKRAHYETLGAALVQTLRSVLGILPPDDEAAWVATYGRLAEAAAAGAESEPGEALAQAYAGRTATAMDRAARVWAALTAEASAGECGSAILRRLIDRSDAIAVLFHGVDLAHVGGRLGAVLEETVGQPEITAESLLQPFLQHGVDHAGFGVRPEFYAAFNAAAAEEAAALGSVAAEDLAAWAGFVQTLADAMAAGARSDAGIAAAKAFDGTRADAQLIVESWGWALEGRSAAELGLIVYEKAFAVDSAAISPLFEHSDGDQAQRLGQMFAEVVDIIRTRIDELVPTLTRLGVRHHGYGVDETHYPILGQGLFAALTELCGRRWTAAHAAAWTSAFEVIQRAMTHGAEHEREREMSVVRATWAQARDSHSLGQLGDLLYDNLFAAEPAIAQALFHNVDRQQQSERLMGMMGQAVALLGVDDGGGLKEKLAELGVLHAGYGVDPPHYRVLGKALLTTLQDVVADFGPDGETAWGNVYDFLQRAMLRGGASPEGAQRRQAWSHRQLSPAELVAQSWGWVKDKYDLSDVGRLFYESLFAANPALSDTLFKNVDRPAQATKLMTMVDQAVALLGTDAEKLVPVLQDLGRRHIAYGTKEEHYPIVGNNLVQTLRAGLGDQLTEAHERAWNSVYGLMQGAMLAGAAAASSPKEQDAEPLSEAALVAQAWGWVKEKYELSDVGRLFYESLFAANPALSDTLFKNVDRPAQATKLMTMVDQAVALLGTDAEKLVPVLQDLGRRHIAYGTKEEHYPIVGNNLVQTLRAGLGDQLTEAHERAWNSVYGLMQGAMLAGAAAGSTESHDTWDTGLLAEWGRLRSSQSLQQIAANLPGGQRNYAAVCALDDAAQQRSLSGAAAAAIRHPGTTSADPSAGAALGALMGSQNLGAWERVWVALLQRSPAQDSQPLSEAALVAQSWGWVKEKYELSDVGRLFYESLFAANPALSDTLFKNVDRPAQATKLMTMVDQAVALLGTDAEKLVPVLQDLGRRHIAYGTKEEHYPIVGNNLVQTLRAGLGDQLTEAHERAWNSVYGLMQGAMLAGAAAASSPKEQDAEPLSEAALVAQSWGWVKEKYELSDVGRLFYESLFAANPALSGTLFKNVDRPAQATKLMTMVDQAVALLGTDAEKLVPVLQDLGRRHIAYGTKEEHYPIVGNNLVQTLRAGLGDQLTEAHECAWNSVYGLMQGAMLAGAAAASSPKEQDAEPLSEAALVAQSWGWVKDKYELSDVGRLFYESLFAANPALSDTLFKNVDRPAQATKLMTMVDQAVALLGTDAEKLVPVLQDLGRRHIAYGTKEEHYPIVGNNLVQTLRAGLGDQLTEAHERAWNSVYGLMQGAMLAGAAAASSPKEQDAEPLSEAALVAQSWGWVKDKYELSDVGRLFYESLFAANPALSDTLFKNVDRPAQATKLMTMVDQAVALLGTDAEKLVPVLQDLGRRHIAYGTKEEHYPIVGNNLVQTLRAGLGDQLTEAHERAWNSVYGLMQGAMLAGAAAASSPKEQDAEPLSEAALVAQSWGWVKDKYELSDVGRLFYESLFAANPALSDTLFKNVDRPAQATKLMTMVDQAVALLGTDAEKLVPVLQDLGRRHIAYGTKEEHYPIVGNNLVQTLRAGLGDQLTEAHECAWNSVYGLMQGAMLAGAAAASSPKEQDAEPLSEAALVAQSWGWVKDKYELSDVGRLFYESLFAANPALSDTLFKNVDRPAQATKLMTMVDQAVALLGTDAEKLVPVLQDLGRRHIAYGTKEEHYPIVGNNLVQTLRAGLGDQLTEAHECAWNSVYGLMQGAMLAGAAAASSPKEQDAEPLSEAALVAQSWGWVKDKYELSDVGRLFYESLFAGNPALSDTLFKNVDRPAQATKLMTMVDQAVALLGTDAEKLVPVLQDLGRRHIAYGTKEEHYPIVGNNLVQTLRAGLGDQLTEAHECAWNSVYGLMQGAMLAGAAAASSPKEQDAEPLSEAALVAQSWGWVKDKYELSDVGRLFYESLFAGNPALSDTLFKNVDRPAQATKLMTMVDQAVALLGTDAEKLVPVLQDLGRRHIAYGTKEEHYPIVGNNLVQTLRAGLGDQLTEAHERAWNSVYGLMQGAMLAGAAAASSPKERAAVDLDAGFALVQESWAAVKGRTTLTEVGSLFYENLFALDPRLPDTLFKGVNREAQAQNLMAMVDRAVGLLTRDQDELQRMLHSLGARHVAYGTEEEHYKALGITLVQTLRGILGAAFTHPHEAAWAAVYALLQKGMLDGAVPVKAAQAKASITLTGEALTTVRIAWRAAMAHASVDAVVDKLRAPVPPRHVQPYLTLFGECVDMPDFSDAATAALRRGPFTVHAEVHSASVGRAVAVAVANVGLGGREPEPHELKAWAHAWRVVCAAASPDVPFVEHHDHTAGAPLSSSMNRSRPAATIAAVLGVSAAAVSSAAIVLSALSGALSRHLETFVGHLVADARTDFTAIVGAVGFVDALRDLGDCFAADPTPQASEVWDLLARRAGYGIVAFSTGLWDAVPPAVAAATEGNLGDRELLALDLVREVAALAPGGMTADPALSRRHDHLRELTLDTAKVAHRVHDSRRADYGVGEERHLLEGLGVPETFAALMSVAVVEPATVFPLCLALIQQLRLIDVDPLTAPQLIAVGGDMEEAAKDALEEETHTIVAVAAMLRRAERLPILRSAAATVAHATDPSVYDHAVAVGTALVPSLDRVHVLAVSSAGVAAAVSSIAEALFAGDAAAVEAPAIATAGTSLARQFGSSTGAPSYSRVMPLALALCCRTTNRRDGTVPAAVLEPDMPGLPEAAANEAALATFFAIVRRAVNAGARRPDEEDRSYSKAVVKLQALARGRRARHLFTGRGVMELSLVELAAFMDGGLLTEDESGAFEDSTTALGSLTMLEARVAVRVFEAIPPPDRPGVVTVALRASRVADITIAGPLEGFLSEFVRRLDVPKLRDGREAVTAYVEQQHRIFGLLSPERWPVFAREFVRHVQSVVPVAGNHSIRLALATVFGCIMELGST